MNGSDESDNMLVVAGISYVPTNEFLSHSLKAEWYGAFTEDTVLHTQI